MCLKLMRSSETSIGSQLSFIFKIDKFNSSNFLPHILVSQYYLKTCDLAVLFPNVFIFTLKSLNIQTQNNCRSHLLLQFDAQDKADDGSDYYTLMVESGSVGAFSSKEGLTHSECEGMRMSQMERVTATVGIYWLTWSMCVLAAVYFSSNIDQMLHEGLCQRA